MVQSVPSLLKDNLLWFASNTSADLRQSEPATYREKLSEQGPINSVPFNIPEIDNQLADRGLRFGALHEIINDPTNNQQISHNLDANSLACILLANSLKKLTAPKGQCYSKDNLFEFLPFSLWISSSDFPAPFLLLNTIKNFADETKLIKKILFIKTNSSTELLKTIDSALSSPAVANIVASVNTIPFATERRIAIRAKHNNAFVLLLRNKKALKRASTASTRWSVTATTSCSDYPCWRLRLENQKGCQSKQRDWLIKLEQDFEGKIAITNHIDSKNIFFQNHTLQKALTG